MAFQTHPRAYVAWQEGIKFVGGMKVANQLVLK